VHPGPSTILFAELGRPGEGRPRQGGRAGRAVGGDGAPRGGRAQHARRRRPRARRARPPAAPAAPPPPPRPPRAAERLPPLLALRAAKNLGCDVPPAAIDRAVDYVQRCYDVRRGTFGYLPNGQLTVPCAGTGILGLELGGKKLHRAPQSLRAGAYIMDNPPQ